MEEVEFSAYAFNTDGVKSDTHRLPYDELPGTQSNPGRAYVIVVGVNAYQNDRWDLHYAADDARANGAIVAERLEASGAYEEVHTVSLIAERGASGEITGTATRADVRAVLDVLAGKAGDAERLAAIPGAAELSKTGPDDLVYLAFSGHGLSGENGLFHLFLSDIGEGDSRVVDDALLESTLDSDELARLLHGVDAGDFVMVIDACNAAASVEGGGFKPGPMGSRGLGQLAYDKAMRVLAASQAEAVALESDQLKHGLLTYAMLREGLAGGAADRAPTDGAIDFTEMLNYGVERVPLLYEAIQDGSFMAQGRGLTTAYDPIGTGANVRVQRPKLFNFGRSTRVVSMPVHDLAQGLGPDNAVHGDDPDGPAHDHGDERFDASDLVSSLDGRIDAPDDVDYFRIHVTSDAPRVTIYTIGNTDTDGWLIRETADGRVDEVVYDDSDGDGDNFQISKTLEAGTYYVLVTSPSSDVGDYSVQFIASEVPTDDHSDVRPEASHLITSLDARIDRVDDIDYFRIDVTPEAPWVTIYTVGEVSPEIVLMREVDDDHVEEIPSNEDYNYRISRRLEPGRFYIEVQSYNRWDAAYTIHLDTAAATMLETSIDASLEHSDDVDYYRIVVTEDAEHMMVMTTDVDIVGFLIRETPDGDLEEIARHDFRTWQSLPMPLMLTAGTYYIRVEADWWETGDYTIHLYNEPDHSDSRIGATILTSSAHGFISPGDDVDYFRIAVSEQTPWVTVETTGNLDTYGILMRENADGTVEELTSDDFGGDAGNFRIMRRLDPGTYFVEVESFGLSVGEYSINLNATDVTVLNGSLIRNIERTEDLSVFQITVPAESHLLTIETTGELDTVGVLVRVTPDGNTEEIARNDDGGQLLNFRISRPVEVGTYLALVRANQDQGDSGEYTIHSDTKVVMDLSGSSAIGVLEQGSDIDYYRIAVTEDAPWVTIEITGDVVGTSGVLMRETADGDMEEIRGRARSLDYAFRMSRTLEPDTYFVKVWNSWDRRGEYTIDAKVAEIQADDHGDHRRSATVLTSSVGGMIEHGEDVDYFRIEFTDERSWFVLETTGELDTVGVLMMETVDGNVERIATDNYGCDDSNFRMSQEVPAGTYFVAVVSQHSQVGEYTIILSVANVTRAELDALVADAPSIGVDEERSGSLTGEVIHPNFDRPIEAWTLRGEAGTVVYVDLVTSEFDAYLYVIDDELGVLTADDFGDSSNAGMELTLPSSGEVKIFASSYDTCSSGDYLLTVSSYPPPPIEESEERDAELDTLVADPLSIGVDEERSGSLTGEVIHPDFDRPIEAWMLRGEAGTVVYVDLMTGQFDAYLYVVDDELGVLTADDFGDSSNARMELTLPSSGEVKIFASSYDTSSRGDYFLRVSSYPPPPIEQSEERDAELDALVADAPSIGVDEERSGSLTGEVIHPDFDRPIEAWTLRGEAGTVVYVDLVTSEFDAYLYVIDDELGVLTADDFGDSSNARMELTLPSSGEVKIFASSYDTSSRGDYLIRVSSYPPPPISDHLLGLGDPVAELPFGSEFTGILSQSDALSLHGFAQHFTYSGSAGEEIILELVSDEFDTYLYLTGPGMSDVLSDDDGAGSLNSRIQTTLPETGSYSVVVTTAYEGSTGVFRLRVFRAIDGRD